jgi:hypothetical protein
VTHEEARPDVAAIESGLKDFQRATVDYVFGRLYTDERPTRRFLIADEVGLGKTLVARGVIARAIDHLWDTVKRIDVVYICSNADIARQNINRLNVTGRGDFALASRITLLPLQYHEIDKRRLNFISFTPGTSFDLKSKLGMWKERVLLYLILEKAWKLKGTSPRNVLSGDVNAHYFRSAVGDARDWDIDARLSTSFLSKLEGRIAKERQDGKQDLRTRFDNLCSAFSRSNSRVSEEDKVERRAWVAELRSLLAQACLGELQPDLIILDEFQRFKHLLKGGDEASLLAHGLFEYADEQSSARVILLSATPYKMYTLSHEVGEDHYRDFLDTLRFLLDEPDETARLEGLLEAYRAEILRAGESTPKELVNVKLGLQDSLRKVMVRTERLAATGDRSGMLAEVPDRSELEKEDVLSFLALEAIARGLGKENSLEYWKSASYLLNFMEDYDLKRAFREAVRDADGAAQVGETLASHPSLLLPWRRAIEKYRPIDPRNPRLRALQAETLDRDAWKLLWIPPSLPYYKLAGPYASSVFSGFSKRLVFSSWKVVPRVIASLLSYEAERRMITSFDPAAANTPEEREKRRPLLRFSRSEGRLTGLPLFSLIYPCMTLARDFDPLVYPGVWVEEGRIPSVGELLGSMGPAISTLIESLPHRTSLGGADDERWYWLAPVLLDLAKDNDHTQAWWNQEGLASEWSSQEEDLQDEDGTSAWNDHVTQVKDLLGQWSRGELRLGTPPGDLGILLAQLAVAGPGVVMLRSLSRLSGAKAALSGLPVRNEAARVARSFLSLFNLPEAIHLIRGLDAEEPFWRRVLEYCLSGGLQAVMDEYVHVLEESLGLIGGSSESSVGEVAEAVRYALELRTSTPAVDEIRVGPRSHRIAIHSQRMRNRFAVRFGEERTEGAEEPTRSDQVRAAFNSPFWPFVLATTSIGQEGLDFHTYCHIVIHWNLPSNPVDLEQREGRVHRYKGHAVRKNVAARFGIAGVRRSMQRDSDPWDILFQLGVDERTEKSDVVPFWVYPLEGGARIERRLMMLPLSREVERADELRRSLAVYRMVFGQPRQEDLVSYLLRSVPEERAKALSDLLRIDLSPPAITFSGG